jgi:hypothetical protein
MRGERHFRRRGLWLLVIGLVLSILTASGALAQATPGRSAAVGRAAHSNVPPALLPDRAARPDAITYPLQEGFENGSLGASAFASSCNPGPCPGWMVQPGSARTGTYAAYVPDISSIAGQILTLRQPIAVAANATAATLTFWHRYTFDFNPGTGQPFDGAVLEISVNGGAWTDAGAYITSGSYNGAIYCCNGNPLSGRSGWTRGQGGYTPVTVNLLPFAGQNLLFRFVLGTDFTTYAFADSWRIDDVEVVISAPAVWAWHMERAQHIWPAHLRPRHCRPRRQSLPVRGLLFWRNELRLPLRSGY